MVTIRVNIKSALILGRLIFGRYCGGRTVRSGNEGHGNRSHNGQRVRPTPYDPTGPSFNAKATAISNSFRPWYRILFEFVMPTCVGVWVFAEVILRTLFGTSGRRWILQILMIYLAIESADAMMNVILKVAHK